jgi:hypothetical protein
MTQMVLSNDFVSGNIPFLEINETFGGGLFVFAPPLLHLGNRGRIWAYASLWDGRGLYGSIILYTLLYIFLYIKKKLQDLVQHVPCGLRRRLDSSRFSKPIAIVTSPIAPVSSLRAHVANLEPIYIRLRAHAANFAKGPAQHRSSPAR